SGLSGLNGTDPRGDWTLRIADTVGGDSGTLEKAILKIKVGELVAP
ncbi:proprotein convertase P-domain, (modular protein), partial [bacterium]